MRFGTIGFGRIARKFAKSITYTDNEIVAIASKSISTDDDYLKENHHVKVYQDYEALLKDENVDAIYIALPHKYHYEWIIKALENKKAVLSEKPAVLSSKEMKHIKEVATNNQTAFLEALKTKMNVSFLQLQKDISLIGNIQSIEANFCFDGLALKGTGSYLFDVQQGGALNDVGTYLIGYVTKLINAPIKNVEATAKMVNSIDEHFHATLTFENGAVAKIEGAIDENKQRYAYIVGEKGSIMVPMFNRMIDYTIKLNDGKVIEKNYPIYGDDMTYQINVLADCVKNHQIESSLHSLDETITLTEITENIRSCFTK